LAFLSVLGAQARRLAQRLHDRERLRAIELQHVHLAGRVRGDVMAGLADPVGELVGVDGRRLGRGQG
jgi:hypothetical protein